MGRASKNKKMPDPPPYALRPGAPDIPQPVQLLGSPSKVSCATAPLRSGRAAHNGGVDGRVANCLGR